MKNEEIHVIDQSDQPYGSQRRCCNKCGIMAFPGMLYVEHISDWHKNENRCIAAGSEVTNQMRLECINCREDTIPCRCSRMKQTNETWPTMNVDECLKIWACQIAAKTPWISTLLRNVATAAALHRVSNESGRAQAARQSRLDMRRRSMRFWSRATG